MDEVMRAEWRRQRDRIFDELRRRHSGTQVAGPSARRRDRPQHSSHETQVLAPLGGTPESAGIHGRMLRYETAVSKFNQDRRDGLSCDVAAAFGDACQGSPALVETWRLVASICGERGVSTTTSVRRMASDRAPPTTERLVRASLHHLQDQCVWSCLASSRLAEVVVPVKVSAAREPSARSKSSRGGPWGRSLTLQQNPGVCPPALPQRRRLRAPFGGRQPNLSFRFGT